MSLQCCLASHDNYGIISNRNVIQHNSGAPVKPVQADRFLLISILNLSLVHIKCHC